MIVYYTISLLRRRELDRAAVAPEGGAREGTTWPLSLDAFVPMQSMPYPRRNRT